MLRAETPHGHKQDFETLAEYEASWMWRNSKIRFRFLGGESTCFICGSEETELHHLSYANVGAEQPFELVALCPDHHGMAERLVRGRWASRWEAHHVLRRRLFARAGRELHRFRPLGLVKGPVD